VIETDLEEILDGELYEIENLKLFYNDVAVASLSIVMYTT